MVFNLLTSSAISIGFLLHSLIIGCAIFVFAGLLISHMKDNNWLYTFFALVSGILINILLLMLLGSVGYLNPLCVSIVAGLALGVALYCMKKTLCQLPKCSVFAITSSSLLFGLTAAFAWHAPGYWDDTSFHLPLARFYLEQEAIVLNEYVRFPLFPQNTNMLIVLGLMLGDTLTAQIFATLPWFVIGIGLIGICNWLMGMKILGVFIAVFLVKFIGAFKAGFGYAYVDTGLAMFCWAAIVALAIWFESYKTNKSYSLKVLLLAGFFAGGAAGTKLFGGIFAFCIFVFILLMTRNLRYSLLFGGVVLISGVWWYLRSYLISGDPFHPVAAKYFGYYLWNEHDLFSQISEQKTHGALSEPLNLLLALKQAGVVIWILAIIGFFYKNIPVAIRVMQGIFIAYFIFWFFVSQVDRYLAPIVVLGTFLSFYTLYKPVVYFRRKLSFFKIGKKGLVVSHMLILLLCLSVGVKEVKRNIKNWDNHLLNTHGYSLFLRASEMTPLYGNRLVQLGFENAAYFFTGTAIGDWFGVGRYTQMITCNDDGCIPLGESEMEGIMNKFESRMIAISYVRYPLFNAENYKNEFNLIFQNKQGALFVLKEK
ncbi:hypothetical protein [Cellvibrio sp. PSBB023]|uniref:hypothetical protein n=1 Tax=Cellvibrio sp. PSBB023 TaxID=1945512 RepID=UPI00098F293C|nr:hypothetical protein [Cellvibrio sp. PSBB023]AQT61378.1 hypothetical protein B0D95_15640 [Cellvibrio sp. PSBB023]